LIDTRSFGSAFGIAGFVLLSTSRRPGAADRAPLRLTYGPFVSATAVKIRDLPKNLQKLIRDEGRRARAAAKDLTLPRPANPAMFINSRAAAASLSNY